MTPLYLGNVCARETFPARLPSPPWLLKPELIERTAKFFLQNTPKQNPTILFFDSFLASELGLGYSFSFYRHDALVSPWPLSPEVCGTVVWLCPSSDTLQPLRCLCFPLRARRPIFCMCRFAELCLSLSLFLSDIYKLSWKPQSCWSPTVSPGEEVFELRGCALMPFLGLLERNHHIPLPPASNRLVFYHTFRCFPRPNASCLKSAGITERHKNTYFPHKCPLRCLKCLPMKL